MRRAAALLTAFAVLVAVFNLAQCSDSPDGHGGPVSGAAKGNAKAGDRDRSIPEDTPRIRMALSGAMLGKLEPCGCAGAQLGGLPRRIFHLDQDGRFDLRIEGGDIVADASPLSGLKLLTALQVLFEASNADTRYDVLAVGPNDLGLADEDYLMFTGMMDVPLVASDVERTAATEEGAEFKAQRHREFEFRGVKVRVASLALEVDEDGADRYRVLDPQASWTAALDGAAPETLRVLLVHGPDRRVRDMAELEPRPDLVVGINNAHSEPPPEPEYVGDVPVVFPGSEGRCVLEVTLARLDDGPRLGYAVKELKGSDTDRSAYQDKTTRGLLRQHRLDAAESGMREIMAGRRPLDDGLTYVGSESCRTCHAKDYEIWQNSKHGHAWKTLADAANTEKYPWETTRYPDCVGCHVVGYGNESGFVNPETTPLLLNVGCEECHGPASAHVQNPSQHQLGSVSPVKCLQCHDHDQSPDFDYAQRWPMIRHGK